MLLLSSFGLLVIYSVSGPAAKDQLIYFILGLLLYFALSAVDYHYLKNLAGFLYGLVLILVLVTHFFGVHSFGASRWLSFGSFVWQPSELSKLALILTLAGVFSLGRFNRDSKTRYLLSFLLTIVSAGLVYFQPDLGTALVIIAIWLGMTVVSGIPWRYFLGLIGSLLAFSVPLLILLKDYQRERLLTFINPTLDPLGSGYNVIQAIIAVGSGGIFGQGFGRGTQSHLKFLPAHHTDFIFAALAEEWGLVGSVVLLILLTVLFFSILRLIKSAPDDFGILIAAGVLTMLIFQTVVNVGMNLGLTPITGIPLPLISSGGSSLLITMAALGLIQSIALRRQIE